MAFGNIYSFSYTNMNSEAVVAVISKDGYTGSTTVIDYTDVTPITMNWQLQDGDKDATIIGSTATFSLISELSYQYQEFFYSTDRQYKLTITIDGNLYWAGWLVSGIYNEPYEADKYPIQLQFTDGLGDLQNIPLQDSSEELLTGQYELSDLLQEAIETNNPLGIGFYDTIDWGIGITEANKANYQYIVTLTGTSGTANVNINGTNYLATFNSSLVLTCSDFITSHALSIFGSHNIDAEHQSGIYANGIILSATRDETFTSAPTVTNITGNLAGLSIERKRGSALGQLSMNADGFKSLTCYDTISTVLKGLNACLFQSEGVWWIQSNNNIDEVIEVKNHGFALTDSCESIYKNQVKTIKRLGNIYPIFNTGDVSISPGFEKINFVYDSEYKKNVLSGGFVEDDFSDSSNLNDWIRTSASHIFFSNWNQSDLTIAKVEDAGGVSCRISGVNSEDKIITVGFSDNAGNLEVTFTVPHGFSSSDIIYISYPSGEGEYEGFHTITSIPSGTELVCSGTSFTSNDWDTNDRPRCINFFNSRFLEQEVNPQRITSSPELDDEDGQNLELKIRYKIETTDSQDSDIDGAIIPVLIGINDTTDYFINRESEWVADNKEFYWISTNVVNKWADVTISFNMDLISVNPTNKFYVALGQAVGRGYANITGYLVSDISLSLTPDELATQKNEYTINRDLKNKLNKTVNFGFTDGNLTFNPTFTKNGQYFSERFLLNAQESLPLYNNLEIISTSTQQLNELHEYIYKAMYSHNSLNLTFSYYNNAHGIEIWNRVRENMSMGKIFKITNLTKNLFDGTGELTAIELRPREDLFNITNLSLTNTNHFIYFPGDIKGSPKSVEGIINRINPYSTIYDTTAYNEGLGIELKFDNNNIPYYDSGNIFTVPSTEITWSQPYTIFLAIKAKQTVVADRSLFNSNDNPTTTTHIYVNNDIIYVDSGIAVSTTGSIDSSRIQILVCEFNGASTDFYIDNTLATTVSAGTDQLKGITLMGDNPGSAQDALNHRYYGVLGYNGALSDSNREGMVTLLRKKVQADRIAISNLEILTSDDTKINVTFDKSVTGFDTTGLSLVFRSGTARTISNITGSGTDWVINMSGSAAPTDLIDLVIDGINGATNTNGDYIYPGIYAVDNGVTPSGYSSEALAVHAQYSALTTKEKDALADFVDTLVSDGEWSNIDEVWCFKLNTTDRHIGMKTGQAGTKGSNVTNATKGYLFPQGTAAADIFDTGFNLSTDATNHVVDNFGHGIYIYDRGAAAIALARHTFAEQTGVRILFIGETNKTTIQFRNNNLSTKTSGTNIVNDDFITTSQDGTNDYIYINGSVDYNAARTAATGIVNGNMTCGRNWDGGLSLLWIGGKPTSEVNLYNAVNQLMTDLD